jgi:hypothetical protein
MASPFPPDGLNQLRPSRPREAITMILIGRHVSKLSGYAPALPTPFDDNGNIDGALFEQFCDRQIQEGAAALVVCGTTGEAPTLSLAEHRTLIRIAAGVSRGRIPVIAGAGSNSTAHAIELTRDAEARGADAILSIVPYYNKPTQAGLLGHFKAIAQSTGLPIILYDVPSRTACSLADETVARLGERPQFMGLMFAGRFLVIVPVLAIAGSLAAKRLVPRSTGTLSTDRALFLCFLLTIIVIVGGLTYLPALALGPIIEHLQLVGGALY